MLKLLFLAFLIFTLASCNKSFFPATFGNRNVYKTKSNLTVKKVYDATGPTEDQRDFAIVPNHTNTKNRFIRYKVVIDEGDYKYIKILPGAKFDGKPPKDTSIINSPSVDTNNFPENYIYQVSKKALVPNTHYLASTALIGKVITLPVRVRNEYWNGNNKIIQGTLSLGYGFGWKYKIGNNPYRPHYFSTILYAAGISAQKHFSLTKSIITGADSLSAKTDEFAVTYLSFGLAYEFDKLNVGIFFGKDKMFGNLKNWVFQDKWWWGIGIGYELFK